MDQISFTIPQMQQATERCRQAYHEVLRLSEDIDNIIRHFGESGPFIEEYTRKNAFPLSPHGSIFLTHQNLYTSYASNTNDASPRTFPKKLQTRLKAVVDACMKDVPSFDALMERLCADYAILSYTKTIIIDTEETAAPVRCCIQGFWQALGGKLQPRLFVIEDPDAQQALRRWSDEFNPNSLQSERAFTRFSKALEELKKVERSVDNHLKDK
ncbi:hypothetical protein BJ508DRAFT_359504 [Ascobolus immersus RN42]|uniref:Uncharacterized protein n=1 Tax=Ascobolus immersus RN42 TaxID=1160509 RepID=A0A3N4IH93_ASCIM|nr:hypothetical protein BJ508DRAFT_359504 [Ascobolus immersus RN42]